MKKVVLISSTGGHRSQIIELKKELSNINQIELTEITEKNNSSEEKGIHYLKQQDRKNIYIVPIMVFNTLKSLYLFLKIKPDIVISTGAGVVIPFLIWSKLFKRNIWFIESFSKVKTPTMTGKIVYKFADRFFVQWETLLSFYPKAEYKGKIY